MTVSNGISNSQSFKYKAALVGKTANSINNTNSFLKNKKLVVPLRYLSKFWRSLEMPLINGKGYIELNWIEDCILSNLGDSAKFKTTDVKLNVPIVTLSTKNNVNPTKQLSNGFKRFVYWNSYQTITPKVKKKKEKAYINYLVRHFRVLKDHLFSLILLLQVLMQIMKQA